MAWGDPTPAIHASQAQPTTYESDTIESASNHRGDAAHSRTMEIPERLRRLQIETPSWGYGNSGTRFHVYPWPGAARNVHERIADAALVHKLTGCCPSVALHIPWDEVDDYAELRHVAEERRHPHRRDQSELVPRRPLRARQHLPSRSGGTGAGGWRTAVSASRIAKQTGSPLVSLWLADGTNYPGQDSLRDRHRRLVDGLEQLYAMLPAELTLLVEYKFFEPGFYSTDLPDWGTAAMLCRRLGPQAKVARRSGTSPAGHQRRADRRAAARGGPARRLPLQQPQVRGRRP